MRNASRRSLHQVLLLSAALVAACGGDDPQGDESGTDGSGETWGDDRPQPPPFGSLEWEDCYQQSQCTVLMVPIDHEDASSGEIPIRLLRRPATEPDTRLGTIVLNMIGEGNPVNFANAEGNVANFFDASVRDRYDIVYWQPRGAAGSGDFGCDLARNLRLDVDQSPDDVEEQTALDAALQTIAEGCHEGAGPLIHHLAPEDHVEDLEWIRIGLGEQQINYLGFSHGGLYGSLYLAAHPDEMGRWVLDAPFAPHIGLLDWPAGQARALQAWIDAGLASCSADPSCAFGSGDAEAAFATLLADLDATPLPVPGGATFGQQHLETALLILASQATDIADFGEKMIAMLAQVEAGAVQGAYNTASQLPGDAAFALFYAVICQHAAFPGRSAIDTRRGELEQEGNTFAAFTTNAVRICEYWDAKGTREAEMPVFPSTTPPGLLLLGEDDFEVPSAWVEELQGAIPSSALLRVSGGNHGNTMGGPSPCIADAVNAYWLEGTTPTSGTECPRYAP